MIQAVPYEFQSVPCVPKCILCFGVYLAFQLCSLIVFQSVPSIPGVFFAFQSVPRLCFREVSKVG